MNELGKLLRHFPHKPWDWGQISANVFTHSPDLQIITIKKMQIIRTKHRRKIQSKILYNQTALCSGLIDMAVES
jgi:hypothetical protein